MTLRNLEDAFLKRFPVPRYVAVPSVGMDISDNSIKWVSFSRGRTGTPELRGYGSESLPKGIVVDGVIEDPKQLSSTLKKIKEKYGITHVRASLPEEKAFLFTLSIPGDLSDNDIRGLIAFKLEEHVPISVAEAVFDFDVARKKKEKKNRPTERVAVVSVFPREVAEAYTNIFLDAGLVPLSLEIEAQAIARAVVLQEDATTRMVVDVGRARSGLSIVSGNVVVFTTTIDIGGDTLTEHVRTLFPDADEREIERIKREEGCLPTEANKELCTVLISAISALRDEINRHLVYWQTHEKREDQGPVAEVLLCGGNANLAGLTDYLAGSLRIPTAHADVWTNTDMLRGDTLPPIDKYHSLEYAPAIGLALHSGL